MTKDRHVDGQSTRPSVLGMTLEQALRRHALDCDAVRDCAVVTRPSAIDLAMVAPRGRWPVTLEQELRGLVPEGTQLHCLAVSSLPLDASGQVDAAALTALPILTPAVVERVERELAVRPDIDAVAVAIEPAEPGAARRHVADLDPAWRRSRVEGEGFVAEREPGRDTSVDACARPSATHRPPAVSEGGPITVATRDFASIAAVLEHAAANCDGGERLHVVRPNENPLAWSYAELLERAERICGGLRDLGRMPGDRVVLVLERPEAVLPAFWGCMLGGFVPLIMEVPARFEQGNRAFEQLGRIIEMLPGALIVTEAQAGGSGEHFVTLGALAAGPRASDHHRPALDDLAFLCFSSGSTGVPKCVMLTHRCVILRNAATNQLNDYRSEDVNLNWLPFDHIGSVAEHIRSMGLGCSLAYVGKDHILEDPLRLLDIIDEFRVSHTWGPNFIYALIEKALANVGPQRGWDLSCVKFLVSGGEAASQDVMRSFLQRAGAFGFPLTGFRPSFGMVELSAGITYFAPSVETPLGFVWLARAGMNGEPVELVEAGSPGAKPYARLGRTLPGCIMRVIDSHGEVLPEATIGRVQFRGDALAAGYLDNPTLTERVFLPDGWLETEDLGFLIDGELVLTGRTKEMLVINGVNYYSRELEDIVEDIEGVEVSFTAACAVTSPTSQTEELAIFFCPAQREPAALRSLLRRVREALLRRARANPASIVPLEHTAIPKTGIGKIRRLELARRFERGDFETELRRVDRLLENEHTLPDWFFTRAWVPAEATWARGPAEQGSVLLVSEDSGARAAALDALASLHLRVLTLEPGSAREDVCRCLETIAADTTRPPALVYLRGAEAGVGVLLSLVQAFAEVLAERPGRLVLVDEGAAEEVGEEVGERACAVGLLATVSHEFPHSRTTHVTAAGAQLGPAIVDALLAETVEPAITWLGDRRHVARLAPVDWSTPLEALPAEEGERWLLVGGLGGVGLALAAELLRQRATLVLVGRAAVAADDPRLESLREHGGELRYLQADVGDPEAVEALADALADRPLHGLIQLVARTDERLLVDETPASLAATLEPFVRGIEALDARFGARPELRFVHVASVVGEFGSFGAGAYSAMHAWLVAFAEDQRRRGRRASCLLTTQWEDTGINAGKAQQDALRAKRGLLTIAPTQGVRSILGALRHGPGNFLIGLDPSNAEVAARSLAAPRAVEGLRAHITRATDAAPVPGLLEFRDDFGVEFDCVVTTLEQMPLDETGAIDRAALRTLGAGSGAEAAAPSSALEQLLVEIWRRVLGLEVGIHDNFFELGGDSIKAVMVMNQLQGRVPGIFHPVSLFDAPTVASLATHLEHSYPQVFGASWVNEGEGASEAASEHMQRYLAGVLAGSGPSIRAARTDAGPRNRRAIFILSTARSGSTLLRVLLGASPQLFSPPELYLLSFRGLRERAEQFSGRLAFLREGLIHSFMALDGLDFEAAQAQMRALEAKDVSVRAVYAALQERLGERVLVDKTPTYAFNIDVLRRCEAEFEDAQFIHLLRHPAGMIHSFEEARVDLAVAVHGDEGEQASPLSIRQKGELWWQVSHDNILDFLAEVPAERQHLLRFEDLVGCPRATLTELCAFLDVPFDEAMLDPHADAQARMTKGAHHLSRPAGDPKFHTHRGISTAAADRWREAERPFTLSDATWRLAARFGYTRDEPAPDVPALVCDPAGRSEPFPLTDIQQAYWAGRNPSFELGGRSVHSYTEIDGVGLDLPRLERAWKRMIERHPMLRTLIDAEGTQRVLETVPAYVIPVEDLRELAPAQRDARLAQLRSELSHRVLPCATWPTFDLRATPIEGDRCRLHLSIDALFFDARSKYILFAELHQFYVDPEVELTPLGLSFRDYVLSERALMHTDAYTRARDYWLARIDTLPGPPALPLVAHPGDLQEPRFFQRNDTLSPALWRRLEARASQARITPSCLLLTVFADALRPWCSTSSFTLNITAYRRLPVHPQVNDILGDFSSLILLAVEAPGDLDFTARARAIQRQLMNDFDHVAFSGIEVLRALGRRRGEARGALAPVVFTSVLGDEIHGGGEAPLGWLGEVAFNVTQTPQLWFDHIAFEEAGGLLCRWNFVEGLLAPGVADALFDAYIGQLRRLAEDDQSSWRAPWIETRSALLAQAQLEARAQINHTVVERAAGLLHAGFFAQAAARPEAVAVIADERTLDYGTLAVLANQLGRRLLRAGAQPNTLIAVALDKGWEQIVAVLGILAAGAAYLPIDPAWPETRVRDVLARSQPRALVTTTRLVTGLGIQSDTLAEIELIALDDPAAGLSDESSAPLEFRQTERDLAYVIFTSGSSGAPKGVMIDHRGAYNTVVDVNERFAIGPEDRVLAVSALGFDLSVWDIFGLLGAGGAVVIPRNDEIRDPARWTELVAAHHVTVWNTVPAIVGVLMDYADEGPRADRLRPLRLVMMSGDWIPLALPEVVRALPGRPDVISLGGATEASIWSIFHPIEEIEPQWTSVPYGRPMDNQRFYVLDDDLEPCPDWVPGMLHIGGVGVALGYLGDPEQSAASFFVHPRTGERLYRTGDLGRFVVAADGLPQIEFLGRRDQQVKIQGFRVELGEIEVALQRHRDVDTAVVVARGDRHATKQLVAYVVLARALPELAVTLQRHLADQLPAYMIPARFVVLEQLPLSANGKVDRGRLPAPPEGGDRGGERGSARAGSQMLAQVAAIASAVLEQSAIAPGDDLFALGASSIDLIRIVNRIEKQLGVRVGFDAIFHEPSVEGIAAVIREARGETETETGGEAEVLGFGRGLCERYPRIVDPDDRRAFTAAEHGLRRPDRGESAEEPSIELPISPGGAAAEAIERMRSERRSHRHYRLEAFALSALADLFACLRRFEEEGAPKYLYGSAGGLYPVQTYLYVKPGRVAGLEGGYYYHDPAAHRLQRLSSSSSFDESVYNPHINRPIWRRAAFAIFLVAQMDAIVPLYRESSARFVLLEAGLMAQLLELHAPTVGLGLAQIGEFDFAGSRADFGLDEGHTLVHWLIGGEPISAPTLEEEEF